MTAKKRLWLAVAAVLPTAGMVPAASAVDIYTETWATDGPVPAPYTTTISTLNGSASVTGGILTLSNGATPAAGQVRVTQNVTTGGLYNTASYSTQLDTNGDANMLVWDLNLQNGRSNPSGFGATNYGAAYVLGASTEDFITSGEGYAVVIGSTGDDPVALVKFTNGMQEIGTGAKSAPYAMIVDSANANNTYQSVRVTYKPGEDEWRLYVRNDGAGGFTDAINTPVPSTSLVGIYEEAASATALDYSGFFWQHASAANTVARFDNIKLQNNALVAGIIRDLTFDADQAGTATDGAGLWTTANTWIHNADATHTTWINDPDNPDNATLGAGAGNTGSFTVDLGAQNHYVGQVKFAANSADYTLANGTLAVLGYDDDANSATTKEGIIADQSATISAALNWLSAAKIDVSGVANTLTVSDLRGSGRIQKNGAGTLLLTNPSLSRSGVMDIETGMVHVMLAPGGSGATGLGSGQANVKSNATLWLDAGLGNAFTIMGTGAGQLFMGEDSILRVTGNVTWQRNYPMFSNGTDVSPRESTIRVDAGSTFFFRAQPRNASGTVRNYHTIHIDGEGDVKIGNSGSNVGGDWLIYSGEWDVSNGRLILAQNSETGGSGGDTLNALGYKNGASRDGNQVTVRGDGMLIGTENTSNPTTDPIQAYKAAVVLSGGTLASGNGKDTRWGGPFTTADGATSTVAVYDPILAGQARNVSLTHGVGDLFIQDGPTNWGGTLIVDPGPLATGGAFNISRVGGTVTVAPGATIQVNAGATLNLGLNGGDPNLYDLGTHDALNDTANNRQVNIVNHGVFTADNGIKNVGDLGGAGATTVHAAGELIANHIRQGSLTVDGTARIRNAGPTGPASGASNVGTYTLNGSAKLDIANNKLITNNPAGTATSNVYNGVQGDVQRAHNAGAWNQPGLTTSEADALTGLTSIGVGTGAQVLGLAPGATDTFAGQTVTDTSTIAMYTYKGDANLDGFISGDDYSAIDFASGTPGASGWVNGDFNWDGFISGDDYSAIDFNLVAQGAPFDTSGSAASLSAVTAVPEPASLGGVMALAAAALLRRQRRSR